MKVSIPSRRVGDQRYGVVFDEIDCGFHPLKAGRRPSCPICGENVSSGFHPLKAGRRHIVRYKLSPLTDGFHPLKAGRRRVGSRSQRCRCDVSIPSRRVGDEEVLPDCDWDIMSFHPLKAGRRRETRMGQGWRGGSFHPLKAGRRPWG